MPANDPKKSGSLSDQLSGLQFGPAWARDDAPKKKDYSQHEGERAPRGKGRNPREGRDGGKGGRRFEKGGGRGPRKGHSARDTHERGPRRPLVEPTAQVSCKLQPCKKAVEAIGQQITKTGHTYPLYTLSKFVLGDRARYVFFFEAEEEGPTLFRGKLEPSLVLSQQEALAQLWQGKLIEHFYTTEEIEVEAPSGNFTSVAKCGMSGVLLGPPNHHDYQANMAKLHRERFPNLSLERFKSRIETLNDEESIAAWKEQQSKKTIYKTKVEEGQEPEQIDDSQALEKHFLENHFDSAFESGKRFVIPGDIPANAISPGLLEWVKKTASDARQKPAALIPTLCNVLTGQRIAVFKFEGKLHTGPSRPHALPLDAKIAEGPSRLMDLVSQEAGIPLPKLIEKVTGKAVDEQDESLEEERRRLLSDLHWLLKEGYVLLLDGGQLHVPKKPIKDRPKEEQEAMIKSQQAQQQQVKTQAEEAKKPEKAPKEGDAEAPADENPSPEKA